MRSMCFIGRNLTNTKKKKPLFGKTALVRDSPHDSRYVIAQFDDRASGYGHHWWQFKRSSFV